MSEKIFVRFDPFRLEGDEAQIATRFEFVLPDIEVTVPLQDTIWGLAEVKASVNIPLSINFSTKTPRSISAIISDFSDTEELFLELMKIARESYSSSTAKMSKGARERIGLYAVRAGLLK